MLKLKKFLNENKVAIIIFSILLFIVMYSCFKYIRNDIKVKEGREERTTYCKSDEVKESEKLSILGDIKVGDLFKDFADYSIKQNEDLIKLIIMLDGQNIRYMNEKFRNDPKYMNYAIKHDRSPNINSFLMTETNLRSNPDVALTYLNKRKNIDGYLFKPSNIYKEFFEQKEGLFPTTTLKEQEQKNWLTSKKFLIGLLKIDVGFVDYVVNGKIPMNLIDEKGVNKTYKK